MGPAEAPLVVLVVNHDSMRLIVMMQQKLESASTCENKPVTLIMLALAFFKWGAGFRSVAAPTSLRPSFTRHHMPRENGKTAGRGGNFRAHAPID